jgi:hypothetical protein
MLLNEQDDYVRRELQGGIKGFYYLLKGLFGLGMQVRSDFNNLVVHKEDTASRQELENFAKSLLTNSQPIPLQARYGHTHIVGGSGHGKTELIKSLLLEDIEYVTKGERSVVVIDSQGI